LEEEKSTCALQVLSIQVLSIQVSSIQVLSIQVLSIQVLSIQVLSIRVPSIQVLSIQVLSIQVLSIRVPSIQVPSIQVPSIQMLAVANPYWDSLGRLNGLVQICNMRCAAYRVCGMGLGSRPPSHGLCGELSPAADSTISKSSKPACERDLVSETWLKRLG
jgi:hypothetical protein